MSQTDLTRFRAMCGQYRWLAVFMVVSVGAILTLIFLVAPGILMARGDYAGTPSLWRSSGPCPLSSICSPSGRPDRPWGSWRRAA